MKFCRRLTACWPMDRTRYISPGSWYGFYEMQLLPELRALTLLCSRFPRTSARVLLELPNSSVKKTWHGICKLCCALTPSLATGRSSVFISS